jgi:FSR family fosmidomycin resistance protein-like MFS transporter
LSVFTAIPGIGLFPFFNDDSLWAGDISCAIVEEQPVVSKSDRISIAVLALGHGITDLYANFLPALLPVFEHNFSLSKTLIGVLIFAISTSGSLCQVVYGYLGDKWGRRFFLVPGPAIAAVFMCFIGLSPGFLVLLLLLIIGGMGVSAFHPHAASSAGDVAGSRRGLSLSLFMAGGTIGYAAGPLIAAILMSSVGPARMPLASIVGIAMSILLYKYVIPEQKHSKDHNTANILQIVRPHLKLLAFLCAIVILRATVSIVFVNFMSLLAKQRGLPLVVGGSIIFLFLLSTALGTVLGGYLSDRMSRRKLLIFSLLLSSPLLLSLVYAEGVALVILLILCGVVIACPNPVPLAIAQELIPEGRSTASSIMMGLGWGIAGILVLLFGVLADLFGGDVAPAMSIAASLPILAAICALPLPRRDQR